MCSWRSCSCQWVFVGMLSAAEPAKEVQSGAILTVAESKRLIAKAVVQMPIVKNALANGMVIIIRRGQPMPIWQRRSPGRNPSRAAFVTEGVQPENGTKTYRGETC